MNILLGSILALCAMIFIGTFSFFIYAFITMFKREEEWVREQDRKYKERENR